MDWSSERYVRVYTRDSVTWTLWSWQSRALWLLLLRRADRAGCLDLGGHAPARAISAVTGVPVEVVAESLQAILAAGSAVIDGDLLSIPQFVDAQESPSSTAQRQRESRERRRIMAGHTLSQPVTLPSRRDAMRRNPSRDTSRRWSTIQMMLRYTA